MADTMLERMARAICQKYHEGCGFDADAARDETSEAWGDWIGEARAALEAIREVSAPVKKDATADGWNYVEGGFDAMWSAAIDAILSEGQSNG